MIYSAGLNFHRSTRSAYTVQILRFGLDGSILLVSSSATPPSRPAPPRARTPSLSPRQTRPDSVGPRASDVRRGRQDRARGEAGRVRRAPPRVRVDSERHIVERPTVQAARAGGPGPHHAHPCRAVLSVQALVLRPARGERHLGGAGGVACAVEGWEAGRQTGGQDWLLVGWFQERFWAIGRKCGTHSLVVGSDRVKQSARSSLWRGEST